MMWDPGCLVGCVTDVQDLWVWHSMACIFYNSVLWHLQSTICRSLTISDGLWRSLTISGDLWRSLTISWDSFERMVPLRSVAPPLGVSLSRGIRPSRLEHSWMRIFANVNAATCCDQPSHLQPPLSMFANMKWHRNGFPHLLLGETLLWVSNN